MCFSALPSLGPPRFSTGFDVRNGFSIAKVQAQIVGVVALVAAHVKRAAGPTLGLRNGAAAWPADVGAEVEVDACLWIVRRGGILAGCIGWRVGRYVGGCVASVVRRRWRIARLRAPNIQTYTEAEEQTHREGHGR